jgi:hypothetical protein
MACLQMIVQFYKGLMKVYTNQSGIYEGINAFVKHKDKDQAAGLEIAESFISLRSSGVQDAHQDHSCIHAQ